MSVINIPTYSGTINNLTVLGTLNATISKSYANIVLLSDVSSLTTGTVVKFSAPSVTVTGTGITYDASTGNFTLTVGTTYLINFSLSVYWASGNTHSQYQFQDADSAYIGNQAIIFTNDNTGSGTQMSNPSFSFIYTPTTTNKAIIKLVAVYCGSTNTVRSGFAGGTILKI